MSSQATQGTETGPQGAAPDASGETSPPADTQPAYPVAYPPEPNGAGMAASDTELPSKAETGERVEALPSGVEAPDALSALVEPIEEGAETPLRLSTILGPLPGRTTVQQTRDLNDAVHQILVVGLVVSTALLLSGLILALLSGQPLPTAMLPLSEAWQQALALQPAGLLSLGLLALLITPIVRVIGSAIVFIWERDWLYTTITLTVLAVMIVSVIVGRG
jgi:uncharacterized membrane protein